jgi:methyltransferase (TIGR00027 family)
MESAFDMDESLISHVSDTALWIAAIRAQETERRDAVFKDPLAGTLAGERGRQIVASIPHGEAMAFAMVVRTTAIDRLIGHAIASGVDTVINLGAGLDTRPYRMSLPAGLAWIEVDYPHLIAYKNDQLLSEKAVCALERMSADLSQETETDELFSRIGSRTKNALVITEGLIGYLANEQAAALSRKLFAVPSFRYWIQDYSQGRMRKNRRTRQIGAKFKHAPWQFSVADPLGFFGQHGWTVRERIFILDEAERIGRAFPVMFPWSLLLRLFPATIKKLGNKTYGYVMFGRS